MSLIPSFNEQQRTIVWIETRLVLQLVNFDVLDAKGSNERDVMSLADIACRKFSSRQLNGINTILNVVRVIEQFARLRKLSSGDSRSQSVCVYKVPN